MNPSGRDRPPLLLRLCVCLLPADVRDEVLGDLVEHWHVNVRARSWVRRVLWLSRQPVEVTISRLRYGSGARDDLRHRGGLHPARRRGFGFSLLDFKLGLRMLVRHPGLTVVATLAMAFGIAVGTAAFELGKDIFSPAMPYSVEGIVRLRNVDVRTGSSSSFLHDFATWRDELRSVDALAAFDDLERNLSMEGGPEGPVVVLAVSATAFDLFPVSPLLGRPLLPSDEGPGAPPVAVIGHDLWQRRYAGDPSVVGRVARLGDEPTTVVGVMPEEFALSMENEDVWVPPTLDPSAYEPGAGPAVWVIGRLATGVSLEQAQAELGALGGGLARQWPDTHEHLRPRVGTYPPSLITEADLFVMGAAAMALLFIVSIMVLVSANVALLLFARAATRQGDIAVRSALGASRSRIVAQLFTEALALAGLAALLGVAAASVGLPWAIRTFEVADASRLPFFIGDTLSAATVAGAVLLALFGAAIAGVLPGLRLTGRRGATQLQRVSGRGFAAGPGGIWSVIIVTQVALTVILVPLVTRVGLGGREIRSFDPGFPSGEFLSVRLEMDESEGRAGDADSEEFTARYEEAQRTLVQRLSGEPGVIGVTAADPLPGTSHRALPVEIDDAPAPSTPLLWNRAQRASVGPDFFEVVGAPIVAGRGFLDADVQDGARVVVVNESFVREFLGGRNAVGQRLRYLVPSQGGGVAPADESEPWYEIVGVARDVAMTIDADVPHNAGVYHPLVGREAYPRRLAIHLAGEPLAFAGRMRELAVEVDPALRVQGALPLDQVTRRTLIAFDSWFRILIVVGGLALLLTEAGIYSIVSYTVSRRTREVGIRLALGADRRRIASTILRRMAWQVGAGVLLGCTFLVLATFGISDVSEAPPRPTVAGALLLLGHMAMMMVVCMLACWAPTRRALRIEPTEALSAEG